MQIDKKILALIHARGGSKGIPRKNIIPFLGKPLIVWTIEAAKQSKYIKRIIVSTEDKEIAEISRINGVEVPFIRPVHLATDEATSVDTLTHALTWLKENENYIPDFIFVLNTTSPLRAVEDIDQSIELLVNKEKEADAVFGLKESSEEAFGLRKMACFRVT